MNSSRRNGTEKTRASIPRALPVNHHQAAFGERHVVRIARVHDRFADDLAAGNPFGERSAGRNLFGRVFEIRQVVAQGVTDSTRQRPA